MFGVRLWAGGAKRRRVGARLREGEVLIYADEVKTRVDEVRFREDGIKPGGATERTRGVAMQSRLARDHGLGRKCCPAHKRPRCGESGAESRDPVFGVVLPILSALAAEPRLLVAGIISNLAGELAPRSSPRAGICPRATAR